MRFCSELVLGTVVLAIVILPRANGESALQNSPAPRAVSVVRSDARTGRLVRSVVVRAKPADSDSSEADVRSMVEETAKNHDVSPFLVDSVIQVESNYNPYATSSKGAQGLMQLMPATARRFGVTNSFDAQQNIEGGVRYLKFCRTPSRMTVWRLQPTMQVKAPSASTAMCRRIAKLRAMWIKLALDIARPRRSTRKSCPAQRPKLPMRPSPSRKKPGT